MNTELIDTVTVAMHNPLLAPLRELIFEEACLPLSEHRLLGLMVKRGVLSGDYGADNLSLFRAHFLVMNGLYTLRDEIRASSGAQLCISPLLIELADGSIEFPGCALPTTEVDYLASYYSNWTHFQSASTDTVEKLLDDFWRRYIGRDELDAALAVMHLSWPVVLSTVKARYRSLAMAWHPDRGGDPRKFAQLHGAYADLKRYLGNDA